MNKLFIPFEEISKSRSTLVSFFWVTLALLLWTHFSFTGTTHLFPTIIQVLEGFKYLWLHELINNITSSLALFLQATVYSVVISSLFAYLSSMPIIRPLANYISTFRFLPLAGVSLYISFLIHDARQIQVSVLVIFMSLFLITSMLSLLKGIQNDIDHAKTLKCTRWEILLEVVIKGRGDYAIEAVRQNLAIIWMMLVLIEMINTAGGGLGYLIGNSTKNGSQGQVIALQLIILFFGRVLDYSLNTFRKLTFKFSDI